MNHVSRTTGTVYRYSYEYGCTSCTVPRYRTGTVVLEYARCTSTTSSTVHVHLTLFFHSTAVRVQYWIPVLKFANLHPRTANLLKFARLVWASPILRNFTTSALRARDDNIDLVVVLDHEICAVSSITGKY